MEENKMVEEAPMNQIDEAAQNEYDCLMAVIHESIQRHQDASCSPTEMTLAVCIDVYRYGKNIGSSQTTDVFTQVLTQLGLDMGGQQ